MEQLVAAEANITVIRNSHVCDVEMESASVIKSVIVQDYETLCKTRHSAKIFIDCTGDADVVKMAGFPVSAPEECQPGTYSVRCSGYDVQNVDWDALRAAFNAAWERGTVVC